MVKGKSVKGGTDGFNVPSACKGIINLGEFIRIFDNTFEVGFFPKSKRHLKAMCNPYAEQGAADKPKSTIGRRC